MLRRPEAIDAGFVESDGARIHYQVFGDGPRPILLLPTWSIVHSDFWRHQVPHLASRYKVIAFDGRGNGASARPGDPPAYGVQRFAEDSLAVLDALAIDEAAIVSASLGASWALVLAAEHPRRVPAAVFIAPDLPLSAPHPEQAAAFAAFDQAQARYDGWSKWNRHYWGRDWPGFLRFFFSKCFTEPDSGDEIAHFMSMGLETTPELILATMDAPGLSAARAERLATSLDCATLVIHGDGDQITPVRCGRELAKLAAAELVVLRGSGHEPQCRNPAEVNGVLDGFLSRHYPAA